VMDVAPMLIVLVCAASAIFLIAVLLLSRQ
jgi:hypothetical protein